MALSIVLRDHDGTSRQSRAGARRPHKSEPATNRCFGASLLQAKRPRPGDPLSDPCFASMFEQREFEIDPDSEEYKQLHPNAGAHRDLSIMT